jgi:hypothetical protein
MSDPPGEPWRLSPAYLLVGRGSKGSECLPRTRRGQRPQLQWPAFHLVARHLGDRWGRIQGGQAPRQTLWPLPAEKEHSVQVDRGK